MKRILLRVLLAATMLAPVVAPAELILYKGTRKDTYTGNGHALTVVWKMILIVDHDTGRVARLQYATANGVSHYSTNEWINTHFVQITGVRSSYTVIAHSLTQCEIDSGATGEGVYCKGPNVTLKLNANSTVIFPKVLSDRGCGLSDSSKAEQPVLDDGSYHLTFDGPGTIASNQAGETLDTALARLTAYLESLGYTP